MITLLPCYQIPITPNSPYMDFIKISNMFYVVIISYRKFARGVLYIVMDEEVFHLLSYL